LFVNALSRLIEWSVNLARKASTKPALEASTKPDLLTPDEVSSMLRVPTTTLAVWRSTGRVQLTYTHIGRAVRYPRDAVEAFIKRGMVAESA